MSIILYEHYRDAGKDDIAYYLALMHCHEYNLFLGTYLELKFPISRWRIVYFPDHYIVMNLDDINILSMI